MKPLVKIILSLQLLIEQDMLPRFKDEEEWNHLFNTFNQEEWQRAKQEVKKIRQRDMDVDGFRNFSLLDPEPIISQPIQLKM